MIRNIATLAACLALVGGVISTDAMARRGRSGTGVEDNLPRHSGVDDVVGGVRLRGDGTVDDNNNNRRRRGR